MPFILRFYKDFAPPAKARGQVTAVGQILVLPTLPMQISRPVVVTGTTGCLCKGHPEDRHWVITLPIHKGKDSVQLIIESRCSINLLAYHVQCTGAGWWSPGDFTEYLNM